MKRRVRSVFVGILAGLTGPGVALAAPSPMFVVETAVTAPSGDAWGHGKVTARLAKEAVVQYQRGDETLRVAIVVGRGSASGCHAIDLQLRRTRAGAITQATQLRGVACEGKPATFDGTKLGAPSLSVALSRLPS